MNKAKLWLQGDSKGNVLAYSLYKINLQSSMTIVVGLDVGRNSAVAAALEDFPANPQRYFKAHRQEFKRIAPDRAGFEYLESINPLAIVLEPTGGHYSAIWNLWATRAKIKVCWVGHADLAHQRGSYGFQNKRDDEDAFCLALTYFDDRFIDARGRKRFLQVPVDIILPVRDRLFQLETLDKNKNAFVNQIRQRLCYEFPEASQRSTLPSKKLGFSPFWGWLAGVHTYKSVVKDYSLSIAQTLGKTSISEFTKLHAYQVVLLEKRIDNTMTELASYIDATQEFAPYIRTFHRFGFGAVNRAMLLSYVYPFEKFLVAGKPNIEWEESLKPGGKLQKRNRSLRSFQAYLGLSYKLKQSGDRMSKSFLGSDMVRSHLYMWAIDRVLFKDDPLPNLSLAQLDVIDPALLPHPKIHTDVGHLLAKKVVACMKSGVKGSDRVTRILFRATALLFRELLKELG